MHKRCNIQNYIAMNYKYNGKNEIYYYIILVSTMRITKNMMFTEIGPDIEMHVFLWNMWVNLGGLFLALPGLRLLSSKAQECKDFWKSHRVLSNEYPCARVLVIFLALLWVHKKIVDFPRSCYVTFSFFFGVLLLNHKKKFDFIQIMWSYISCPF